METEETTSTDVSTENNTTDTETIAADEAARIAGSEKGIDWSDDSSQTQETEALKPGNQDEDKEKSSKAPDAEQTEVDEVKETEKSTEEKTDEAGEAKAESTTDEATEAEETEKADADKLMRQRMGLSPTKGDESFAAMERKHQESSRESHRLVDEMKARDSALKELGVKMIQKDDGQFALLETEDYGKNYDGSAVARQIEDSLPSELNQGFDNDDAKAAIIAHVSKEAHRIELQQRPATNATSDDLRLDDGIVDSIFNEMCNEAIGEGDQAMPFYADMNEDAVADMITEVFQHPSARDFYIQANKTPENMKWFLSACHAQVFRGRAPVLAKMADAKKQKELIKKDNLEDASVSTDSSKSATDVSSAKSGNVDEAALIARSESGNSWL
jgi:hypothetical protein